jgi:hypothetical protein
MDCSNVDEVFTSGDRWTAIEDLVEGPEPVSRLPPPNRTTLAPVRTASPRRSDEG